MAQGSGRVKVIVATGVRPADAIAAALDGTFADFAERHGFAKSAVSMCVHGRQRHERVRQALAVELGVEREWLDKLLSQTVDANRAGQAVPD